MLIALAVIGYYVYQQYFGSGSEAPPSCKAALNACIANCRTTTSEAADNRACQRRCRTQAESCNSGSGS